MAVEHGYMPLGKYSSARDDILHFMCVSDWANDSEGNSEAPTGFFWEITNTWLDVRPENTETASLFSEWFEMNPEVTDSEELRRELVGDFIVSTDSQGFVYVQKFDTTLERNIRWISLVQEFYEWDSQGED